MAYLRQDMPPFRRVTLALFFGGFVTFAILYSTQPLLPEFTREFHVSPATASLSLSVATAAMAVAMLIAGSLSDAWGRKPIMSVALIAAAVLGVVAAFSHSFQVLLIFRVLQGIVLSGLPAIAMAYLSEEIDPASLGLAMGLYVSGNSIGGMSGRIIVGTLTDLFSWRVGLGVIGVLAALASIFFILTLPPSANFKPRSLELSTLFKSMVGHLRNVGLLSLFVIAFMLMGSFVTLYNYIGYVLLASPYNLSQTVVGWIFIIYLVGTFSSTWMGRLADRLNRRNVLWLGLAIMLGGALVTLVPNLFGKIFGIAMFTFGFFGCHSIASSWVGMGAQTNKAQASSLYLFFYYTGSSIGGTLGGAVYSSLGWTGVIGMISVFLITAFVLSALSAYIASRR